MNRLNYSWEPIQPRDRFKQKAFELDTIAEKRCLAATLNGIIDSGWIVSDIIKHSKTTFTIIAYKINP